MVPIAAHSCGVAGLQAQLLLTAVLCVAASCPAWCADVSLTWKASPDLNVVGYILYSGPARGVYTGRSSAGDNTACTVSNLTEGLTYYFMVKAYDAEGVESPPSNEVSYNVPSNPPPVLTLLTGHAVRGSRHTLAIVLLPDHSVYIQSDGTPARTYSIEYSDRLGAASQPIWQPLGTTIADDFGRFSFIDSGRSLLRFYRAVYP